MMTARTIALKNIRHRKFQSALFVFFVFIGTAALFLSIFFTKNMKAGIAEADRRLSADILVVPAGYDDNAKGILFEGKSCTILFGESPLAAVEGTKGVKQASPQLFMETLSLSCCSSEDVELIAIDPATDFSVQTWLAPEDRDSLAENEVIIGSDIGMERGDTITLYGEDYRIARVLSPTGMGYDTAVFISLDAAWRITASKHYSFLFDNKAEPVSMIAVKAEDDADVGDVAGELRKNLAGRGASVYTVSGLIGALYDKLSSFETFGVILNGFVFVTVSAALFTLVTLSIQQRRSRIGSFLSVGIAKSRIIAMFVYEYLSLLLAGALSAALMVCIFVYPLYPVISGLVDVPYKTIGAGELAAALGVVLGADLAMVGIAVSFSFIKLIRQEPATIAEEQV